MKTIFLVILALFALHGTAQETSIKVKPTPAQKKAISKKMANTPEASAGMKTKKLVAELDLSTEQQNLVYDILLENAKKNENTKMNYKKMVDSEEKMDKKSLKEAYKKEQNKNKEEINAKFKNIFTEAQFTKYQRMMSKKSYESKKTLRKQE